MMALRDILRGRGPGALCLMVLWVLGTQAAELPHFRAENGTEQLLVHGKPFLIRGGELGNSSAGTAVQADAILPAMARLHVNTILMPVAWEQVEPKEGAFDFGILDHWIDIAREQHLHLVLLWFGAWKNAFSEYAPDWVKGDMKRFPRAQAAHGVPTEILSTFGTGTLRADSRAFRSVMGHLREKDEEQQTVLMVQVENEMGYLGQGRDRSPEADREFDGPVPQELISGLAARRAELSPELEAHFNAQGRAWREVFGDAANEAFMAWRYAIFVNSVVESGKKEYPLPMYVNAQLPSLMERPGEYPSGGPHPYYLAIYRAMAPAVDFYAPDIYWPEFEYWVKRYQIHGNPIFIPEAKMDSAPWNALYAYGAAKAIGFCPFGIDSLQPPAGAGDEPVMMQVYAAISSMEDMVTAAQNGGRTRGLALHANSPRANQSVVLGGYVFEASLSRAWSTGMLLTNDGGMLLIESRPDEFFVVGSGLTVKMSRDPDTDAKTGGIASIEEVSRAGGAEWTVSARLNGDQSNQGRQLSMDPRRIRIYRVRLYGASQ